MKNKSILLIKNNFQKCSLLHILKKGGILSFSKKTIVKRISFQPKKPKKNLLQYLFSLLSNSFSKLGAWHISDITSKLFLK